MTTRDKAIKQIQFYKHGAFVLFSYAGTTGRLWGWGSLNSPIAKHVLGIARDEMFDYRDVQDVETIEI